MSSDRKGLGDDQGTRVGAPDQSRATPAQHSDEMPDRPERKVGSGSEPTIHDPKAAPRDNES